jgi:hypothetical protein
MTRNIESIALLKRQAGKGTESPSPPSLPSLPGPLSEFIAGRFARICREDDDRTLKTGFECFHSNSWTVLYKDLVFRIGDAIDLQPGLETKFWEIGRKCGARTPNLEESGNYGGKSYMIYHRVQGNPPSPGDFPGEAGKILARLHRQDAAAFPARGNWPDRRNKRFTAAIEFARQKIRNPQNLLALIQKAEADFHWGHRVPNHGDFRSANILIAPGQKPGVIDWTDAHTGSREEDIGGCDACYIIPLVNAYREVNKTDLDPELMVGHSLARILSLIHFGVLTLEAFVRVCTYLRDLAPGKLDTF